MTDIDKPNTNSEVVFYDPNKPMQVGGQAVIEGVMMRAPNSIATAVRRANGKIVVQFQTFKSITEKKKWLGKPILRGAVGLIEMLYLGIKSLNFSADIAMKDEDLKKNIKSKKNKKQSHLAIALTLILGLIIGISIFFALPLYLATWIFAIEQTAILFNLVTGLIRVIILLLYMIIISYMKDIKQVFRYHGAEHKSVFAFEAKAPLIMENVQTFSRFHPRCGTSFLLVVVFVAMLAFSLLDALTLELLGTITLPVRLITHLPFIPFVGGLAYEAIKFSAKHGNSWWGKIVVAPGLWLQKITTKDPDANQIEVAIIALKCALGQEDAEKYRLEPEPELTEEK